MARRALSRVHRAIRRRPRSPTGPVRGGAAPPPSARWRRPASARAVEARSRRRWRTWGGWAGRAVSGRRASLTRAGAVLSFGPFAPCRQTASSEVCSVPTAPGPAQVPGLRCSSSRPTAIGRDDGGPYHPTRREVLREWLDAMDGCAPSRRAGSRPSSSCSTSRPASSARSRFLNFTWTGSRSASSPGCGSASSTTRSGTTGTARTWRSRFTSPWFARAFLWTNPIAFREEMYAIPHRIHHERSDLAGRSRTARTSAGWGAISPPSRSRRSNRAIDERRYEALVAQPAAHRLSGQHLRRVPAHRARWSRSGTSWPAPSFAQALWIAVSYADRRLALRHGVVRGALRLHVLHARVPVARPRRQLPRRRRSPGGSSTSAAAA